MPTHPNAHLTSIGRERLIRLHLNEGRSLAQLAIEHRISELTARKWLARFRSGGVTALADRQSDRHAAAGPDHDPGQGEAALEAEPAAEPRPPALQLLRRRRLLKEKQ